MKEMNERELALREKAQEFLNQKARVKHYRISGVFNEEYGDGDTWAKTKTGALMVIEKNVPLNEIIRSGETINADVNQRLIENIFFKNSPLHDGAMIIRNKQIVAAGCILPVSHDLNIPKELGLRHRAAMGVSQETDALAIIVSEETGGISVAHKGQFHLRLTAEELERILTKED